MTVCSSGRGRALISTAPAEWPLYFVKTTLTFLFFSPVKGTTSFLSFQGHAHQLRLRGDLRIILAIHGWNTVSLLGLECQPGTDIRCRKENGNN
jgi:hypothetical protein